MAKEVRGDVIADRVLNRTYLQRQLLLERTPLDATQAIEYLLGLQAQAVSPPYVALWSRLADFDPQDLSLLIEQRTAVRIASLRSTIHLHSVADARLLRPFAQPAIDRSTRSNHKGFLELPKGEVIARTRIVLAEQARTMSGIGAALQSYWPDVPAQDLGMAARMYVPLVQVPPRGLWGRSGQAVHAVAEDWMGASFASEVDATQIVRRYLAAYGPASVADMQTWSTLTRLDDVFAQTPGLRPYATPEGKQLWDVEEGVLATGEEDAPVRFLGEFDNAWLSHKDRERIVSRAVFDRLRTRNGMLPGTIIIDGHIEAAWSIVRTTKAATLQIEPLASITKSARKAVEAEAALMLATFAQRPDHRVEWVEQGTIVRGM